ncbi:MAG TPA: helix-hairpin-helix domain-containing protein, partial [Saprospiraceae bacterium]|nr:helix-hairpin-helix domain-containing protein [Saprospiraceae bacterium]
LAEQHTTRFRIHAQYRVSPAVELRSRAEWAFFRVEDQARSQGFMVYQEAVYRQLGFPLSAVFRFGIFDTDNFETRVFAYENDIFSAYSVPSFSGRGTRWYLNLNWRVANGLRLEARYDETRKLPSVANDTGPETQRGLRVLARLDF